MRLLSNVSTPLTILKKILPFSKMKENGFKSKPVIWELGATEDIVLILTFLN
jgi:hypothetical protein